MFDVVVLFSWLVIGGYGSSCIVLEMVVWYLRVNFHVGRSPTKI